MLLSYLSLDYVPGIPQANVVVGVVQSQPILQVLLSVLTDLKGEREREEGDGNGEPWREREKECQPQSTFK